MREGCRQKQYVREGWRQKQYVREGGVTCSPFKGQQSEIVEDDSDGGGAESASTAPATQTEPFADATATDDSSECIQRKCSEGEDANRRERDPMRAIPADEHSI